MRISTKGRYSLEAVLYMSLLPKGTYSSTRTIADNTGISEGYLEQLFIPLRRAGIIKGIRGPLGGYFPAKSLKKITVGEILRIVEGPLEPVDCAVKNNLCTREAKCQSRAVWRELHREIARCVDSINMADLVRAYEIMDSPEYQI
ncbi:MAG: Rrf2 family transcriptional regulator [Spirochaetaceae bacterium]|jgi:Rrf2 family protein|nr:Rrf2 family transcriptional regulator [Spirochaetaceae bacterium]